MTQSACIFSKFFSVYRHVIIDLIGRVELNPGANPNIHDIRKVQYQNISHKRVKMGSWPEFTQCWCTTESSDSGSGGPMPALPSQEMGLPGSSNFIFQMTG